MERDEEEKVNIRHTINAQETFTLAKDVFDLRCLIKNVYNNRAVIGRRLNILTLSISFVFTLLYCAYIIFTGLMKKIDLGAEIAIYALLGAYAVMSVILIIIFICGLKSKAKNVIKYKRALAIVKFIVRVLSISITIAALVFATLGGENGALNIALNVILIVFSIITMIIQLIPLLFGGLGHMARWLLSPVKIKHKFSTVALEWYELAVSRVGADGAVKKVSPKYYDAIGVCLDNYLIPSLGSKYVSQIKPVQILNVAENAPEEDKTLVQGILKSVFGYATECGYVTFNPCVDLQFEGNIEEEKSPSGIKTRLIDMGKKIGMSALNKFLDGKTQND